jgi:hypothetical protein
MADYAKVNSIEALKQFRASLTLFANAVNKALDEAYAEIQGTHNWLSHHQYAYWKNRLYVSSEKYTAAQLALKRKKIFDRALQGTPSSCIDERKALKIAEQRLREAQTKFERVRSWISQLEKEELNYKGVVQRLRHAVHVEIPNARASLDRMIGSLEAYVALAPPETVREPESVDTDLRRPADVSEPTVCPVSDDTKEAQETDKRRDKEDVSAPSDSKKQPKRSQE